jgi:hypothetical protein
LVKTSQLIVEAVDGNDAAGITEGGSVDGSEDGEIGGDPVLSLHRLMKASRRQLATLRQGTIMQIARLPKKPGIPFHPLKIDTL